MKNKKKILTAYENNKITLRETSQPPGLNYWETQDLLAENNIPITKQTTKETKEKKRETKKDIY
ncbi:MAG: hypothetical protein B6U72_06965 [Candidatus Altiarchaeales archaeon ex4484_2]|nr:MAG: hypothetical protein B6U72_06965 [Candidatus Altiarchaeales archaeon ex4484_2]